MTLVIGNEYTGKELIKFLNHTGEIVILETGGKLNEEQTYTVEIQYNKCSLHQREKRPVYENNPYTSKNEVVGFKEDYHKEYYKETSIYIVR